MSAMGITSLSAIDSAAGVPAPDLATLLAPLPIDDFFAEYAFRKPLLIRGAPQKFSALFTWDSLNRILSTSRHDPLRVHIDRVGASAEELEFTHPVANVRGEQIDRIDVERLYQRLRDGATLVVDAVNEVDQAVAGLSEEMAAMLSASRATTVLFVSFGHVPGFSVHWDNRDVYALQVEGEKHWQVYEPSQAAPLDRGDLTQPSNGVPGPLVWAGTLGKGDMLYVPRGWWHEVTAADTPALHLNLGFGPVTATDFLLWLAENLKDSALMRRDIPRFAASGELEEYERAVKAEIAAALGGSTVREFLAAMRAGDLAQTHVSLPFGATADAVLPPPQLRVRLTSRMSASDRSDDTYVLRGLGKQAEVRHALAPVIDRLLRHQVTSIAELAETVPAVPLDEVRGLVATLIRDGFLHTCRELPGCRPGQVRRLAQLADHAERRIAHIAYLIVDRLRQDDRGCRQVKAVITAEPAEHLGRGVLQGLLEGPGVPDRPDRFLILPPRPPDALVLPQANGEHHVKRSLDAGGSNLACPLGRVPVAEVKQGSGHGDRQVDGCASAQAPVVHVAAVSAGRSAPDDLGMRGGHAETAEHRTEPDFDVGTARSHEPRGTRRRVDFPADARGSREAAHVGRVHGARNDCCLTEAV
jgi:ribosomal protein L16 Arg81 hydroxylase